MPEPYVLKGTRTVLRGERGSNIPDLPDLLDYDYLLVLEDSPVVQDFFSRYPQYAGQDSHVGLYPLPLA